MFVKLVSLFSCTLSSGSRAAALDKEYILYTLDVIVHIVTRCSG